MADSDVGDGDDAVERVVAHAPVSGSSSAGSSPGQLTGDRRPADVQNTSTTSRIPIALLARAPSGSGKPAVSARSPPQVEHAVAAVPDGGAPRRRGGHHRESGPPGPAGAAGMGCPAGLVATSTRVAGEDLAAPPGGRRPGSGPASASTCAATPSPSRTMPKQDVLGPDVVVAQLRGLAERQLEDLLRARGVNGTCPRRLRRRLADDGDDLLTGPRPSETPSDCQGPRPNAIAVRG